MNQAKTMGSNEAAGAASPELHEARVIGLGESDEFRVQAGPWVLAARRSASCLLEPTESDRVLVAVLGREAFILAVLERQDATSPSTIVTEGDLALVSRNGRVSVTAAESVALEAPSVSTSALRITLAADAIDVAGRALSLVGDVAQMKLGAAKLVARTADAVLERLFVHAQRSFRRVDTMDQVRAGQLDMAATDCAMLRGGHTIVDANGMVKVDGAQVHIG